jgi:hypothetical protein
MAGRVAYYGNIVKDGLILDLDAAKRGSYPGTGTTWNDISGFQYNGTLTNGPTFNSSNGGSIVFDGVDDTCKINSNVNITPGLGNFTLDLWINPVTFNTPFSPIYVTALSNGLWIGTNNTNFVIRAYAISNLLTYAVLPTLNTWTNVIISRNSTTFFLYYNGVQVSTSTATQNFVQGDIYLASDNGGTLTNIKISSTKYYNRALSSTEVLQNYNATKGRYI